jgi:hypothetical protein
VFVLNSESAKKAGLYEAKQTISAFICEFFAGVAPLHYAPKRD